MLDMSSGDICLVAFGMALVFLSYWFHRLLKKMDDL